MSVEPRWVCQWRVGMTSSMSGLAHSKQSWAHVSLHVLIVHGHNLDNALQGRHTNL